MSRYFPHMTGGEASDMWEQLNAAEVSLRGTPPPVIVVAALRIVIKILVRLVWS